MEKKIHKLVILGSGPAGLTAAIYAARANLSPILVLGNPPGGQLMNTTYVENWPGEKKILGPTLMFNMMEQAKSLGADFQDGNAESIECNGSLVTTTLSNNQTLTSHALIIATGARHKHLGCPGEQEYWSKGITSCATCDGAFFKNKRVLVVGGGDTAMEDASFLRNYTNDITIVQISSALSASYTMQQRIINDPTVKILYNTTVQEIIGDGQKVTGVRLLNSMTNEITTKEVDGIFVAIGLSPNTTIFKGKITMNDAGYLTVTDRTKSSIPGIFVAGDVHDFHYRQAITAAGMGCMAALDAERYLSSLNLSK